MAAPHVCGSVALLLGAGKTPAQAEQDLIAMATPNKLGYVETGTPNLLLYVGSPAPTSEPTTPPTPEPTPEPTNPPTPEPTDSPTAAEGCVDSPLKVVYKSKQGEAKFRSCAAVARNKSRFCDGRVYKVHCPNTCGTCDDSRSKDSNGTFVYKGKQVKCLFFKGDETTSARNMVKMRNWCRDDSVRNTCRQTCSYFQPCDA